VRRPAAAIAVAIAVATAALPGGTVQAQGGGAATGVPGPGAATAKLAAIVAADDARKAVVIGTSGEVYEPDGNGAWIHKLRSTTANPVSAVARTGGRANRGTIFAFGDGVIYQLASNGWSAIRLAQHGKAILGVGTRPLAAVGRQLLALDQLIRGEPAKLALAPAKIVAIGAGARTIVLVTEAGTWRLGQRGALVALATTIPGASPATPMRLVSDRWAIVEHGVLDLTTRRLTTLPGELAIEIAAVAPDDGLAAIGSSPGGLELLVLRRGTLSRDPLGILASAGTTPVGVVVDRAGRALVALSDGRIVLRQPSGWSTIEVTDEVPAEHPGAPPATSS
jgi:hypothetical protein